MLLVAALIAQSTLMHNVRVRGVEPSLVLVLVVWYAVHVDTTRAALYGMLAGLGEDIFSGVTGGAWTLSTTLVAVLAGMLSRGFLGASIPLVAAIAAVATLVRAMIFWVVMGLQGYPSGLGMIHLHEALLQAVLNAAMTAVFMFLLHRFGEDA